MSRVAEPEPDDEVVSVDGAKAVAVRATRAR